MDKVIRLKSYHFVFIITYGLCLWARRERDGLSYHFINQYIKRFDVFSKIVKSSETEGKFEMICTKSVQ